jgi:nicotinamide-nucleotide amidase
MKKKLARIAEILTTQNQTLACGESCTGGQISAFFVKKSGASKFFIGAIVSYADEVKRDLLGVTEAQLRKTGAVSKEVALEMAKGVCRKLKSDWSVAVTGIAGPTGGTRKKPVGLVFYAVAGPRFAKVEKRIFSGNRKKIQKKAVNHSVELLLTSLEHFFQRRKNGSSRRKRKSTGSRSQCN